MATLNENPATFNRILYTTSDILFTQGLDQEFKYEADRVGYSSTGLKDFIRILGRAGSGGLLIFSELIHLPKTVTEIWLKGLPIAEVSEATPDLFERCIL